MQEVVEAAKAAAIYRAESESGVKWAGATFLLADYVLPFLDDAAISEDSLRAMGFSIGIDLAWIRASESELYLIRGGDLIWRARLTETGWIAVVRTIGQLRHGLRFLGIVPATATATEGRG